MIDSCVSTAHPSFTFIRSHYACLSLCIRLQSMLWVCVCLFVSKITVCKYACRACICVCMGVCAHIDTTLSLHKRATDYFIIQFGWPKPRYDVIHLQVGGSVSFFRARFTSFPVLVINPALCTEPSWQRQKTHVCLCLSVWFRACECVWI